MTATIQWYPGHMAKAMRRLAEDLRIVDVVIEAVDARVPGAGANPSLERLAARKPRLLVLTRDDLAQPVLTTAWLERYAIVVGIPNSGKSTLINALVGKNVARTEDRAGVTRAPQWFRVTETLELIDTAGILVPKIDTPEAQWKLAMIGAVPRARFDAEDVVGRFAAWAAECGRSSVPDLETYAKSRGFVRRGNVIDMHNAAWAYMKEFNEGRFGRLTLEEPA